MSDRERSASPVRELKPKKQKMSGFKWKDKKPKDDDGAQASGTLERGYRDRSPRRESYREREDDRRRRDEDRDDERRRDREPERRGTDNFKPSTTSDEANTDDQVEGVSNDKPTQRSDIESKFGPIKPRKPTTTPSTSTSSTTASTSTKKPKKPKSTVPSEPMIIVHVNDRLGTKAAVPCLPSDTIKQFKAIVAAQIGRRPHEIMLKRQGMRAFKDHISLADYEISNGVQLDLELDTGD